MKKLLIALLFLPTLAFAQSAPFDITKGLTKSNFDQAFKSKVDTTNGTATGLTLNNGTAIGTDISAADLSADMTGEQAVAYISNSVQFRQCTAEPMGAWINTSTNIQQMLDSSAYPNLTALHSTQFWLNSGAAQILAMGYSDMYHPISGEDAAADVTKAISIINASGQPSIEVDLNPWMMPSLPTSDYDYSADGTLDSNSIFFYGSNGNATLPVTGKTVVPLYNQGLHPTTVFVNTNFHADVQAHDTANGLYHSEKYISDVEIAASDIKTQMPSVKNVVIWQDAGYDDTHASSYDPFEQFAKDPYYANDRTLALKIGAFGLDIPPSMMMAPSNGGFYTGSRVSPWLPDSFARFEAGMIIWAKENGVAVYLFVSPFQQDSSSPQYGFDTLFTKNTVAFARYLAAHSDGTVNALPNFWMVGQYSPNNTSNSLGNETDDNSITHTMLQILEGPYSDKVHLSASFALSTSGASALCATGTGYNNIPSDTVTNGIVRGFSSTQPAYGGYEMGMISDGMKISNQNGMAFIDDNYLDSSLTSAPPIVNVKGTYDGSSHHGLLYNNLSYLEFFDRYHLSIPNGTIVTGSYNSDGTPIIDTTSASALNNRTEVTYAGAHYNWWFTWANNQVLGASLSQDGLSVSGGITTPKVSQPISTSATLSQTGKLDASGNAVVSQTGVTGWNYGDPAHSMYIGGKVLSLTSKDSSPVLDTSTTNYMSYNTWTNGAFDFNFFNGNSVWNAFHLETNQANFYVPIKTQGYTKSQLLSLVNSNIEGSVAYDEDDHVGVMLRCPTTTTCAWYPMQYGDPISN